MVVGLLAVGCSHMNSNMSGGNSIPLSNTSVVPGADGEIRLTGSDQNNKTMHLVVHHLAQPQELNPGAVMTGNPPEKPQTYVVWLQPMNGGPPENIGALMPDKNLDAELTTNTTQRKFNLFITAEPSATQTAPTGQHLLQATVQD